jgi:hypothetical protein
VVEVVFNLPPDQFTKTLDQIGNATWMRADVDGDGTVDRSTELQNTDSQGKYGTTDLVISGGQIQGLTVADQAVQAFLDLKAFPKPAADLGGGRGQAYIELFCRGWINTLGNRVWNQTADTGTQAMSAEIRDIIGSPAVEADSLLTDLIAWWDMEEAAGSSRVDSHGANDLAENGGPIATATGKRGLGVDLERGSSQFLSIADNASLSTGDIDFAFAAWIKLETVPSAAGGVYTVASKQESAVVAEWQLLIGNANDQFRFVIYNAAGAAVGDTLAVGPVLQAGTWYFVHCWHDATNDVVGLQVNGGEKLTVATTGAPTDTASAFRIGARYAVSERFFDGIVEAPLFRKSLLTDFNMNRLYRDGMGMSYSMIQQAVAVSGVGEYIASQHRAPNTTSVTKELDADRKALDIINNMTSLGDADNNRYLLQGRGRTPTSVKGRRAVFKQAAPVVVPPSI